jgi:hypothetical protein
MRGKQNVGKQNEKAYQEFGKFSGGQRNEACKVSNR